MNGIRDPRPQAKRPTKPSFRRNKAKAQRKAQRRARRVMRLRRK